jgi:hypothetical protein
MSIVSPVSNVNLLVIHQPRNLIAARMLWKMCAALSALLLMMIVTCAQTNGDPQPGEKPPLVVEGVTNGNVYGFGRSIKITGTLKEGAVAIGGDVIVQGTVEGDVAAIGGSVIQLEGARIGGDVIVVGGSYRHADKTPNRNKTINDVIYAGYEQELRDMMRNPTGLLAPRWSSTYFGLRLLAVLFWFVVSLALTAAMPGAVSRGVARLQLTSLRVGAIGFLGAIVVGAAVAACLRLLPTPFSAVVGMMALLFILLAGVFGRVVIYAATGRWLQRKYLPLGKNSESVALLLGTVCWAILSSLPYVWPGVVAVTLVLSFGLALTAGRRNDWKKATAA